MYTAEIHEDRIQHLNEDDVRDGGYVLYWMQQSQRAPAHPGTGDAASKRPDYD